MCQTGFEPAHIQTSWMQNNLSSVMCHTDPKLDLIRNSTVQV